MYEAKLEFPEGCGSVLGQIPSMGGRGGGYGYFLELHIRTNAVKFNLMFMKTIILKIVT